MVSHNKLQSNRLNAQRSTGPRTPEGKRRSSQNALRHGYFSSQILLPGESQEAYDLLRATFIARLKPCDPLELSLVERLVNAHWRLRRLQGSEHFELIALQQTRLEDFNDLARRHAEEAFEPDPEELTPATLPCPTPGLDDHHLDLLSRLSTLERRLEGTISRTLRDLRQLRKDCPADARDLRFTPADCTNLLADLIDETPDAHPGLPPDDANNEHHENAQIEPTTQPAPAPNSSAGAGDEVPRAARTDLQQRPTTENAQNEPTPAPLVTPSPCHLVSSPPLHTPWWQAQTL